MPTVLKRAFSGNFLTRYAQRIVADSFPRKLKRMLYVVSALAIVIKNTTPSVDILSNLNRALELGYQPASMLFPAYISNTIWHKQALMLPLINNIDSLTDQDYWRLAKEFAMKCPDCLAYGSLNLMAFDIHAMLKALGARPTVINAS